MQQSRLLGELQLVGGEPADTAEDLHGGRSKTDFHDLLRQRVGHAVETSVEGDVLVDVRRGTGPLAQIEVFCGQGRQNRLVQNVEQAGP